MGTRTSNHHMTGVRTAREHSSISASRHARERGIRLSPIELTLTALLVVALFAAMWASRMPAADRPETVRVTVAQGDTLWALAASHPIEGLTTAQTADLIAEINGLESATLATGASLLVPAQEIQLQLASR